MAVHPIGWEVIPKPLLLGVAVAVVYRHVSSPGTSGSSPVRSWQQELPTPDPWGTSWALSWGSKRVLVGQLS